MILITCSVCGCENQISESETNWEELTCELCGQPLEGENGEEELFDDEIPF